MSQKCLVHIEGGFLDPSEILNTYKRPVTVILSYYVYGES